MPQVRGREAMRGSIRVAEANPEGSLERIEQLQPIRVWDVARHCERNPKLIRSGGASELDREMPRPAQRTVAVAARDELRHVLANCSD
jgi:hypothetical protein